MDFKKYPNLAEWFRQERIYFKKGTGFTDYHAAVIATEVIPEKWIALNSPYPVVNVEAIFLQAEQELSLGYGNSDRMLRQLTAWFGANGLQTHKMKPKDFWRAAKIMWPSVVLKSEEDDQGMDKLHSLISRMTKKSRRRSAAMNRDKAWKIFNS